MQQAESRVAELRKLLHERTQGAQATTRAKLEAVEEREVCAVCLDALIRQSHFCQLRELKRFSEELDSRMRFQLTSPAQSPETDAESLFASHSPFGRDRYNFHRDTSDVESNDSYNTLQQDIEMLTDRLRGPRSM